MSDDWGDDDDTVEPQGGELAALDFDDTPPSDDEYGEDAKAGGAGQDDDDDSDVPTFTVTNPAGTVSVTAFFTGPIKRVELDPSVVKMTEHELAQEIQVLAGLAQAKAKSVMHAFLLEGLTRMGHDRAEWGAILSSAIDLPSPEQAAADQAKVFAARYREGV